MKINKSSFHLKAYVVENILFVVMALALLAGFILLGHQQYTKHSQKSAPLHPQFTSENQERIRW